jgi:sugar phosphate isomerase/epimerase
VVFERSGIDVTLAGIGDEAAPDLAGQIGALRRLGWSAIELRSVDGIPIAGLTDERFSRVADELDAAGLRTVCVDSQIGNWARPITTDPRIDHEELRVLAPRCRRLGTPYLRIMSYPNDELDDAEWRRRTLDRIRRLAAAAERCGVVLLHENCAGWAGRSGARMLELLDSVASPALGLLFDIGNGVAYDYDSFGLLTEIVDRVSHVHIKDAVGTAAAPEYVLPGQGRCRVADCLRLLLDHGYAGAWTIEPHVRTRPHDGVAAAAGDEAAFVAYGRHFERLMRGLAVTAGGGGP